MIAIEAILTIVAFTVCTWLVMMLTVMTMRFRGLMLNDRSLMLNNRSLSLSTFLELKAGLANGINLGLLLTADDNDVSISNGFFIMREFNNLMSDRAI